MIAPAILVLLPALFYVEAVPFKPMDPELALKAIEGYEDVLAPERTALESFYRQFRCKKCGGACRKEMVKGHVFAEGTGVLNPRAALRCLTCSCLFDPHSGLLLEIGNSVHGVPIIKPDL
jgi:hypothetical protein